MSYTKYTTKEGDRWDLISYRAYGDVSHINDLIAANQGVAATPTLPAGVELRIPIESDDSGGNDNLLPPWKR